MFKLFYCSLISLDSFLIYLSFSSTLSFRNCFSFSTNSSRCSYYSIIPSYLLIQSAWRSSNF